MATDRIPPNPSEIPDYINRKIADLSDTQKVLELSKVFTLTSDIAETLKQTHATTIHLSGVERVEQGSIATLLQNPNLNILNLYRAQVVTDEDIRAIATFLMSNSRHGFFGSLEVEQRVNAEKERIIRQGGIQSLQLEQAIRVANAEHAYTYTYPHDSLSIAAAQHLKDFQGKALSLPNISSIHEDALASLLSAPHLQHLEIPRVQTLTPSALGMLARFEVYKPQDITRYITISGTLRPAYLEAKTYVFEESEAKITVEEDQTRIDKKVGRTIKAYNAFLQKDLSDTDDHRLDVASYFELPPVDLHWSPHDEFIYIPTFHNGKDMHLILPNPLGVGNTLMGPLGSLYNTSSSEKVRRVGIKRPAFIDRELLEKNGFDLRATFPADAVEKGEVFELPEPEFKPESDLPPPLPPAVEVPDLVMPPTLDPFAKYRHLIAEANASQTELNLLTGDTHLSIELASLISDPKTGYQGSYITLPYIQTIEPGALEKILSNPNLKTLSLLKVTQLDTASTKILKHFQEIKGNLIISNELSQAIFPPAPADKVTLKISPQVLKSRLDTLKRVTGGVQDMSLFFEEDRDEITGSLDALVHAIRLLSSDQQKRLKSLPIHLDHRQSTSGVQTLGGKHFAFVLSPSTDIQKVSDSLRLCFELTEQVINAFHKMQQLQKHLGLSRLELAPGFFSSRMSEQLDVLKHAIGKLSQKEHRQLLQKMGIKIIHNPTQLTRIARDEKGLYMEINRHQSKTNMYNHMEAELDAFSKTEMGQQMLRGRFSMPEITMPRMPKVSIPTLSTSTKKRIGAVLAAGAVGAAGAYAIHKTTESGPQKKPVAEVMASSAGPKEELRRNTMVTFASWNEAVELGYFVRESDGSFSLDEAFAPVDPSVQIDPKNPRTFRLVKIGLREVK